MKCKASVVNLMNYSSNLPTMTNVHMIKRQKGYQNAGTQLEVTFRTASTSAGRKELLHLWRLPTAYWTFDISASIALRTLTPFFWNGYTAPLSRLDIYHLFERRSTTATFRNATKLSFVWVLGIYVEVPVGPNGSRRCLLCNRLAIHKIEDLFVNTSFAARTAKKTCAVQEPDLSLLSMQRFCISASSSQTCNEPFPEMGMNAELIISKRCCWNGTLAR